MRDILLTGGDLEEAGSRRCESDGDRAVWGFSPGIPRRWSMKHDANEDALCYVDRGTVRFAAVADSHWGRAASEAAVRAIHARAMAEGEPPTLRQCCRAALEGVAALDARSTQTEEGLETATALLVARLTDDLVELASMADCRSFRIRQGGACESVTDTDASWLGLRSAADGLRELDDPFFMMLPWNEASYPPATGEALLLATDGLTECVYGVPTLGAPEFGPLIDLAGPLLASGETLLDEALRTDRVHEDEADRGGEDNVAFVLLRTGKLV